MPTLFVSLSLFVFSRGRSLMESCCRSFYFLFLYQVGIFTWPLILHLARGRYRQSWHERLMKGQARISLKLGWHDIFVAFFNSTFFFVDKLLNVIICRNKGIENVITIDLHGQHVKQAMKLLKIHLLFGTYAQCKCFLPHFLILKQICSDKLLGIVSLITFLCLVQRFNSSGSSQGVGHMVLESQSWSNRYGFSCSIALHLLENQALMVLKCI